MVDRDRTVYRYTSATGVTGRYGLTSITDSAGRALTLTCTGTAVTTVTSASGRSLTLTWTTPAGASAPHVDAVVADPAIPGNPTTASTWTYTYTGDLLTGVCARGSPQCTAYTYQDINRAVATTLNVGPRAYWRLADPGG